MPKVFILILHWQNYEVTKRCLESFRGVTYKNFEIIVLDNASTNDSPKRLKSEFPEMIFIFNTDNRGYGAGMNPGIQYALKHEADYIFLLNNDVIVHQPNFIQKLVEFMETHPRVGILGPKLLFTNGTYQKSYNKFILSMALEPWWPGMLTTILRKLKIAHSKENDIFRVAWLNAVALFLRRGVFDKIGLMDERFFLGAEDIDLSLRAKREGWETWYYPEAELIHVSFVSHIKNTIAYDNYYAVSTVQFLYKHYPRVFAFILQVLAALGFFLRGVEWFVLSIINRRRFHRANEFFAIGKKFLSTFPKRNI